MQRNKIEANSEVFQTAKEKENEWKQRNVERTNTKKAQNEKKIGQNERKRKEKNG